MVLIVAILMFFIITIIFYRNNSRRESIISEQERLTLLPSQREMISNYIQDCIRTFTRDAVNTVGITSSNKAEFEKRIESNINLCFDVSTRDFFEKEEINVLFGNPKIIIDYSETAIIVDVDLPTTITGYGIKEHISKFNYDLKLRRKVNFPIDLTTGEVIEKFKILSENAMAVLEFERGNKVTKEDVPIGKMAITILPIADAPIIGNVMYNFGSIGDYNEDSNLEFEEPAVIDIFYSEEDLPPNVLEEDLEIGCKDKGLWKAVPTVIDTQKNIAEGLLFGSAICALHTKCNDINVEEVIYLDTGELENINFGDNLEIHEKGFPIYIAPGECINSDLFKFIDIYINGKSKISLLNEEHGKSILTKNNYDASDKIIGKGSCFAPVQEINYELLDTEVTIGPDSTYEDQPKISSFYDKYVFSSNNKDDKKTVNQNFFEAVGEGINYISFEDIDLISDLDKKFGRAILKIGKIDQNTHISCGETQIFDNFQQIILGDRYKGKCYDGKEENVAQRLFAYYPNSICEADYSEPVCTELFYCPVYPENIPYSFDLSDEIGKSQRMCSYSYLDHSTTKEYNIDFIESGKVYCLPDLSGCSQGSCLGWCAPDKGGVLNYDISLGEGIIAPFDITCGKNGEFDIPTWSELVCEYKGKNYHYDSVICKESETQSCGGKYCEEMCYSNDGVFGWQTPDLSGLPSKSCSLDMDSQEVFCKTIEGKKYELYSVACIAEENLPYPPIDFSDIDFEVVCVYDINNGPIWEKIGNTYAGDACFWLPNFNCEVNYCQNECTGIDCLEYCNRRQTRECR